MNADIKGALARLETGNNFMTSYTHRGDYLNKSQVKKVLEYGLSKGYETIAEISDEEIDQVLASMPFCSNRVFYRHTVLSMEGLVQKCIICGETISDYRNTMAPEGTPPPQGFAAGIVYVSDGNPVITQIADPAPENQVIDCKTKTNW